MASARSMPMPESVTETVLATGSKLRSIVSSGPPSRRAGSASARKRSLSQASDAFETSSLRKISRSE